MNKVNIQKLKQKTGGNDKVKSINFLVQRCHRVLGLINLKSFVKAYLIHNKQHIF